MKNLLKAEEVLMFGLSIYLFNQTDFVWWWFLVLILAPDVGMLGYVMSTRVGAITYNLFHHKGIAVLVLLIGYLISNEWIILSGIILFGHSSLDRIFGYGLKYSDNFKHTHLGLLK